MSKIIPTTEAIEAAIREGEAQWNQYDVTLWIENVYCVQHKEDNELTFFVDTELKTCQCEVHKTAGICFHQYIADQEARAEAEGAKWEAEQEAAYYGENDLSRW